MYKNKNDFIFFYLKKSIFLKFSKALEKKLRKKENYENSFEKSNKI